jgi:hypothetical protein
MHTIDLETMIKKSDDFIAGKFKDDTPFCDYSGDAKNKYREYNQKLRELLEIDRELDFLQDCC